MKLVKTLLAGAAVAGSTLAAAAVPTTASAQSYGYGYADPCRAERNSRGVIGGLLGAGAGVAFGHNITGRDDRDTGRIVGGILGGLVGAGVGANTGPCAPAYNYAQPRPSYGYAPAPAYGYSQPSYGYARPSYGHAQPSYGYAPTYAPSYGYSDPYAHRGASSGGYTYESRSVTTVYPSQSYGYTRPVYSGYGY